MDPEGTGIDLYGAGEKALLPVVGGGSILGRVLGQPIGRRATPGTGKNVL